MLEGRQAFDGSAFVSHNGMIGKAPSHCFRILPVLDGDIGRHGCGKIDKYMVLSSSVTERQVNDPELSRCIDPSVEVHFPNDKNVRNSKVLTER